MKKNSIFKYALMILSLILLALPVFLPSNSQFFDVIGVCVTIAIILSYPLGILAGMLFFMTNWFDNSIGSLYLMLFVFCVAAYVQWFVLVPRLAKFIRRSFFRSDIQINWRAAVAEPKTLPESTPEYSAQDWQKKWYDDQKRTPVERLINKDKD